MKDRIISILKQSLGYLSGEELSRQLSISRAGIWKNIQELRREGYDVLAVSNVGYKLNGVPDKLLPREVKDGLSTQTHGREYHYFESLPSTMDHAFELAVQGASEGTLVCAETQTRGRGRMERVWNSPKAKGIYMSMVLRPELAPADVAKMTLFAAVAICEAVINVTQLNVRIKWPNDLLIDGKKIAGILTEMSGEMDRVRFIILGVGLNVNTTRKNLPETATSLKLESGHAFSRIVLLQEILQSVETWSKTLHEFGFDPITQRWRELSTTLGKNVSVGDVSGKAIDLDHNGGLIIETTAGERIRCMSGDVVQHT